MKTLSFDGKKRSIEYCSYLLSTNLITRQEYSVS